MDYFNLKFQNTTIRREIFAGISLFMTMSYILVICPTVLSETGMNYEGVFLATVFVSGISTIISAVYTKLPFALAPGLGVMYMFLNLATGPKQIPWTTLLFATYAAGIILCLFVKVGIYDKVMELMDVDFRRMITSGTGFALLVYGISTLGLLEKKNGFYTLGEIQVAPIIICAVGLLIICLMKKLGVRGYVMIGILAAYFMSIGSNYYESYRATGISISEYLKEIFAFSFNIKDISNVMHSFPNVIDIFSDKQSFADFANATLLFAVCLFFDAIGTNTASFDTINKNIDIRVKETLSLKRAINVDGVGSILSGLFGTSSVTTYAESMIAIASEGKTGITALTTGCLFLLCVFLEPLFMSMAAYVVAPALIYVGIKITFRYKEFDKSKKIPFVLGLCIIGYIGVTFNIGNALLYGLILYTIIKMATEKEKPVSKWWILLIFAIVHIGLNYIF